MKYSVAYRHGTEFAWFISLTDARDFRELASKGDPDTSFVIFSIETGEEVG